MDFIDGKDLDEFYRSKARTRSTEKELEKHFRTLISTVKYMHSKGYAHSDIKPANIVVDKKGVLHLVDLGAGCNRNPCSTVATKTFLAPDIKYKRSILSARKSGDIFAIGASLLELVDPDALENFAQSDFKDTEILYDAEDEVTSPYLKKILSLISDKQSREKVWASL